MLTRTDIEEIVRVWQGRLRLSHWAVTVDWDTPLDEDWMLGECEVSKRYDTGTIRFGSRYATWDRAEANRTVVHELLHLHGRDLDEAVGAIEGHVSAKVFELHAERFRHENEGVIERMATVLVELGGVV